MTKPDANVPPPLPGANVPLPPPASSLLSRLLNVFAIPSAVFEEVAKSRHSTGNWLLPTLLSCLVMALWSCAVLAMPAVQKKLAEVHEQQIKTIERAVVEGKQTQAEADELLKATNTMMHPTVMRVLAVGGGVASGVLRVFAWALVLWFLARRILQAPLPYLKTLELAGLSSMIALLGTIVKLALVVDLHPAGGGIAVSDLDAGSSLNLTVVMMNLLRFWLLAVMATGLARLTGGTWFRAALPIFICWMLFDLLMMLVGFGLMAG